MPGFGRRSPLGSALKGKRLNPTFSRRATRMRRSAREDQPIEDFNSWQLRHASSAAMWTGRSLVLSYR
jgi:hypothetical protein